MTNVIDTRYECVLCGNECEIAWSLSSSPPQFSCGPCYTQVAVYWRSKAGIVPTLSWEGAVIHIKDTLSVRSLEVHRLKEVRANSFRSCVVMLAGLPHSRPPVP